jgi:hypothetical protein
LSAQAAERSDGIIDVEISVKCRLFPRALPDAAIGYDRTDDRLLSRSDQHVRRIAEDAHFKSIRQIHKWNCSLHAAVVDFLAAKATKFNKAIANDSTRIT